MLYIGHVRVNGLGKETCVLGKTGRMLVLRGQRNVLHTPAQHVPYQEQPAAGIVPLEECTLEKIHVELSYRVLPIGHNSKLIR